jgi:flagellar L-ring protein precursor FlgH
MAMNSLRVMFGVLVAVMVSGCNTDPSTTVHQPMTVRPTPQADNVQRDGAIYRATSTRPLFEDPRARFVGDTLTVKIVEKTTASKKTSESYERDGDVNVSIPTPTVLGRELDNIETSVNSNSSSSFENEDSGTNSNNFTGSITVTVIEVLPNGYLVVSGEKQVAINERTEFIRFSGVVNPISITPANTVNSTQIADARIESKNKQSMDTAQIVSLLSRFFLTLVPF